MLDTVLLIVFFVIWFICIRWTLKLLMNIGNEES